jgi:hypothetical protein
MRNDVGPKNKMSYKHGLLGRSDMGGFTSNAAFFECV